MLPEFDPTNKKQPFVEVEAGESPLTYDEWFAAGCPGYVYRWLTTCPPNYRRLHDLHYFETCRIVRVDDGSDPKVSEFHFVPEED